MCNSVLFYLVLERVRVNFIRHVLCIVRFLEMLRCTGPMTACSVYRAPSAYSLTRRVKERDWQVFLDSVASSLIQRIPSRSTEVETEPEPYGTDLPVSHRGLANIVTVTTGKQRVGRP